MIYLDSAASTKISAEVRLDLIDSLERDWMNPSSIYEGGRDEKRRIGYAREQVKNLINAREEDNIIFCSCGSEANNLAIKGFIEANDDTLLITDMVSHPSVYNLSNHYYDYDYNTNCIYCKVDRYGRLDLEDLGNILHNVKAKNVLVATTWVNNETGVVNEIKDICEIVHEYNGHVLIDCCQGVYHHPIDVEDWDVDMITFTSEKMGMPRGCSALFKKNGAKIAPQIIGGHQEDGYRAGTENTVMIIPFGKQCERIGNKINEYQNLETYIGYQILMQIQKACDGICEYEINGYEVESSELDYVAYASNILSIRFEGYNNQELLTLLSQYGVYCSAGSACSSHENKPSRVLTSIGLTEEQANSTLRFSFDHTLQLNETVEFGQILRKCLVMLKNE